MIEAREYFEAALQLEGASWQAHFGAVMGLADIDRREEAWQESISKWNEAIGIARTHANAIYESFAIRGLGETWFDRGDMSRAEPLLKRSLALVDNRSDLPECLAELWSWNGDTERARDYSRQVTTIMASHFAAESPALASALVSEAIVEQRANRLEDAAGLYAKAFNIVQATRPSSSLSQAVAPLYAGVLSQLHRGRGRSKLWPKRQSFVRSNPERAMMVLSPQKGLVHDGQNIRFARLHVTFPLFRRGEQHSQVA